MRIINDNINIVLAETSHKLCAGFITGPIRIIGAIAQLALNALALFFSAIPNALGFFNKNDAFYSKNLIHDAETGFLHLGRGLLETLPGSSFFLDTWVDGRPIVLNSDHPFRGDIDDSY